MLNARVKLMIKVDFDLIQFDKPATAEEVQRLEKLNIILKKQKEILNDLPQKMGVPIVGAYPM